MINYLGRRLLLLIPILVGVTTLVFLMRALIPGDPVEVILGGQTADRATLEQIRSQLGLDQPLPVQYLQFVGGVLRGDLGTSIRTGQPVTAEIGLRYPRSLALAGASMAIAILIGFGTGILSAVAKGTFVDFVSMVVALIGVSMPSFWLGLVLMRWFAVELRWFPVLAGDAAIGLVLPAITLGVASAAVISRLVRSSLIESLQQDYVRTARAKGLLSSAVTFKHALRNALIPAITVVGIQFGFLLGGVFIVESVFAVNGIGFYAITAIQQRDFPVIQGIILIVASTYVLVNLLVDLSYVLVDPRISYA